MVISLFIYSLNPISRTPLSSQMPRSPTSFVSQHTCVESHMRTHESFVIQEAAYNMTHFHDTCIKIPF